MGSPWEVKLGASGRSGGELPNRWSSPMIADLGADAFQTFRLVTFPLLRTALLAGGLLAFGLSFDEIVVTTFTSSPGLETLPLWIFNNLARGDQQPIVTVVATAVMVLSVVPVWLAQRLTSGEPGGR